MKAPAARFAYLLALSPVCIHCTAHWQFCTVFRVQAQRKDAEQAVVLHDRLEAKRAAAAAETVSRRA